MPLIQGKGKKAFGENVKKEMDAGKPQPQALAIAYSIKRKNSKKKMAHGGKADTMELSYPDKNYGKRESPEEVHSEIEKQRKYAEGGQVSEREVEDDMMEHAGDERRMKPMERVKREGRMAPSPASEYMASHFEQGGAVEHASSTEISDEEDEIENRRERAMLEREHQHDKPRMASGGMLDLDAEDHNPYVRHGYEEENAYAEGGEVPSLEESHKEIHDDAMSLAGKIIQHRKRKMQAGMVDDGLTMSHGGSIGGYAEGGEVDLERNSEEDLNNEDQMSFKAGLKEQYDLRQLKKQPMGSNEKGDEREHGAEDDHDENMISSIRRKMKKRA